jgi:two-component system, NarL family, nitrate/nitrite response regulator NarL
MNWTQPIEINGFRRLPVSACETQPLMIEGLKSTLTMSGLFILSDTARSLEEAARIVMTSSPRIMILDKSFGGPAVLEWVTRMSERCPATGIVIWGSAVTESEALRYLKLGAKGIIRKTSEVGTVLACLESVAGGSTWMEDSLFREPQAHSLQHINRMELTRREHQVLELVEQGLRNKEIASELGIRPGTVKIHLKHIFEKTGVRGRYGLALSGLRERSAPHMLTA